MTTAFPFSRQRANGMLPHLRQPAFVVARPPEPTPAPAGQRLGEPAEVVRDPRADATGPIQRPETAREPAAGRSAPAGLPGYDDSQQRHSAPTSRTGSSGVGLRQPTRAAQGMRSTAVIRCRAFDSPGPSSRTTLQRTLSPAPNSRVASAKSG